VFREIGDAALRVLVAPLCVACDATLERPLSGPVCEFCWHAIPRLTPPCCPRCGDVCTPAAHADTLCARCQRDRPIFEMARSAGAYDGSLRAIIHAFKYGKCRALGPPLASLLRQSGADVLQDADAVVPVPLHWRRLLVRGFNQADDLARGLGKPIWRLLRRRRSGPPQATLAGPRRADNVSQAFSERQRFAVGLLPRELRTVRFFEGPTVVLIDDVLTTGATANACARELIHAGVRRVRVLTVARAVAARPVPRPLSPDPLSVRHR